VHATDSNEAVSCTGKRCNVQPHVIWMYQILQTAYLIKVTSIKLYAHNHTNRLIQFARSYINTMYITSGANSCTSVVTALEVSNGEDGVDSEVLMQYLAQSCERLEHASEHQEITLVYICRIRMRLYVIKSLNDIYMSNNF